MRAVEVVRSIVPAGRAVHVHCADPGAWALLGELEPALRAAGLPGAVFVEGWAADAAAGRGEPFSPAAFRAAAAPGDLLLLGARVDYARTRHVMALCREAGVACALVLDHWKNYAEHFLGDHGPVLPDRVLVPDEMAARGLAERFAVHPALSALTPCPVTVLGHPAMEKSLERIRAQSPEESQAVLRSLGVAGSPVAALFLDPVRPEDGYGYDAASVVAFVARWARGNRPHTAVLVKPHPRQPGPGEEYLAPFRDHGVAARLASGPFEPLVAAADEVWGMTSMVLVTALRAGRPVISFQPGRTESGRNQSNPYLEPWVII